MKLIKRSVSVELSEAKPGEILTIKGAKDCKNINLSVSGVGIKSDAVKVSLSSGSSIDDLSEVKDGKISVPKEGRINSEFKNQSNDIYQVTLIKGSVKVGKVIVDLLASSK